jgi:hypothetical protein
MNLTKPLVLGLGALLVNKMLSRGNATDQSSVPQGSSAGAPSPDGGLVGGLGGLLEKLQTAGHGEAAKSWVGSGQNQPIEAGQLRSARGRKLSGTLRATLASASKNFWRSSHRASRNSSISSPKRTGARSAGDRRRPTEVRQERLSATTVVGKLCCELFCVAAVTEGAACLARIRRFRCFAMRTYLTQPTSDSSRLDGDCLTPRRLKVCDFIERELADRVVDLGYGKPGPVRGYVIREEHHPYDSLVRREKQHVAAHGSHATACTELHARASYRSPFASLREAPTSQVVQSSL